MSFNVYNFFGTFKYFLTLKSKSIKNVNQKVIIWSKPFTNAKKKKVFNFNNSYNNYIIFINNKLLANNN